MFQESKRWGFVPSVSAAWRIAEEPFFRDWTSVFDELKIRACYGTTGNDLNVANREISAFAYAENYINSGSYIFADRLYQRIARAATPNRFLTWATSTTYNGGMDRA